jgi:hypothetical protein
MSTICREMRKWVLGATALAGLWGAAQSAQASVLYSYVTDASSYEAPPYGPIVPVNIYLQETLTGGSSSFIAANGGLFSSGAAVNEVGVSGGTASQIPTNPSPRFAFSGFTPTMKGEQQVYTNQPTNANNLEFYATIGGAGVQGPLMPDANGRILLGTLNIMIGTGQTTFALTSLHNDTIDNSNSELGQSDTNTITDHSGYDLDAGFPGLYTGANDAPATLFTVGLAPVPEPTSLAIFGAGAIGLLWRRRRAK